VSRAAGGAGTRDRWRLAVAAIAVMLAAADTYVVVLALPAIMGDLGIGVEHLERATPIISGFLLGYVAFLPLLGRLSDIAGRGTVLGVCLLAFGFGSVVTASAHGLGVTVTGRVLQGLGGGGLVPVTLAIVADCWPAERRGLPLGIVGGVQELGSVLGPLYGAAIISATSWRVIFWLNVPLSVLLAAGYAAAGRGTRRPRAGGRDLIGIACLIGAVLAGAIAVAAPAALTESVTWGVLATPLLGDSALTEPLVVAAALLAVAFCVREVSSDRAFMPLRRTLEIARRVDVVGALLLAAVLGCIVISFAGTDPAVEAISTLAWVLLPAALFLFIAFVVWESRCGEPIVPNGALRPHPAWGALLTNLAVGAGLIAALVDVPIFARATSEPASQVGAALVLLRFLIGVPVGAVIGGALCRHLGNGRTTGLGMALATGMFAVMAHWDAASLGGGPRVSDAVLVACGVGFGLAIAPVNAAILGAVPESLHGLGASLAVVARQVGMIVGVSLLTVIGLHAFDARAGSLSGLCPPGQLTCPAYDAAVTGALLDELRTIFTGAAICCGTAAIAGLATLGQGRKEPAPGPEPR
jgi:MFS family permease